MVAAFRTLSSPVMPLAFILVVPVLGAFAAQAAVEHPIGAGPDDWWITYPYQRSNAGSPVDHPSWALEPLEEGPVIVLIHSSNCPACLQQESAIRRVLEDLGDEVVYLDVLTETDHLKAWDGLVLYYPTGDPESDPIYIPGTVFLTLGPGTDGEPVVLWHSSVGSTGEGRIRSRLQDAIALYQESSQG
jgi:hypothetical protein